MFSLCLLLTLPDTIAAVSSPAGAGERGIVRLSGPRAWTLALTGFAADSGRTPPRRRARPGGPAATRSTASGRALPAALWLWPGPRTYTGQPSAEVHTFGSPPLLQHLLAHFLTLGARAAGPGEFTLRAFLSGRIDLTRAEAVLSVIEARSPAQLDAALGQLAGGLASPIAALRDRLLDVLAHLEANLDFVDEPDVDALGRLELAESLAAGSAETAALAARLDSRDRTEGALGSSSSGRRTPARAGSSTPCSAPRAPWSHPTPARPATTSRPRSTSTASPSNSSTRPARSPHSRPISVTAQALRAEQSSRADLLLDCVPADGPLAPSAVDGPPRLLVLTKSDLAECIPSPPEFLPTSAATGAGLDALRSAIADTLRAVESSADLATTTGARCREGLVLASKALASAASAMALDVGDELVSIDIRQAVDELGKVIGAVVTDDVLDRIFGRFCIGK